METIGQQELWSFVAGSSFAKKFTKNTEIRRDHGHLVTSFVELATKIAELQFRNQDHVLLFRGQRADYRNVKRHTTLKPTLFRSTGKVNPEAATLIERFQDLQRAEELLGQRYQNASFMGMERVARHRVVRWTILQHYEVCPTPLLDVTHSLRIAASFATHGASSDAFIFVLAVPNLSGGITASAEAGLQIVRLSSVCPPSALRPHIPEGYLLGEYPEMIAYSQKELYRHYEIDFGRRLIAKFRFEPESFWKLDTFPLVSKEALYPDRDDPLHNFTLQIKQSMNVSL